MAARFFSLHQVPEDEAQEVAELLDKAGIDYYTTQVSRLGLSAPAIWLQQETELTKAKALLAEYQSNRATVQRQAYLEAKAAGEVDSIWLALMRHPFRLLIVLVLISLFAVAVVKPFFLYLG